MSGEERAVVEDVSEGPVEAEVVGAVRGEAVEGEMKSQGVLSQTGVFILMVVALVVLLVVVFLNRAGGGGGSEEGGDSPMLAALKADVQAGQLELNRQRMAMGLAPIENGIEPLDEIVKRVKTDTDTLLALAGRFQQMLGEKDAEITGKNGDILRLERMKQDLIAENSRLSAEYQRALIGGSEANGLKKLLADSQGARDALAEELLGARARLTEAGGAVNADEYSDLQRRFDETMRSKEFFENRVKELEAELAGKNLFAKSEDELLPAAVELFRRLRTLEGNKDSDNTNAYSEIGVDLGASVLHTLTFATGSSELNQVDKAAIGGFVAGEVPDGDLVLIVGYASKTGDPAANERLSSDRATGGAKFFVGQKRQGQQVQAVYIGQTDRFSSRVPERNQICEIWRIRAK